MLELVSPHGRAQVSPLGAQVLSATLSGRELLWLTPRPGVPLRGGVPICFPWFGSAARPSHGFARLRSWDVISQSAAAVSLALGTDPMWPHTFAATMTIALGESLRFDFAVTNTDSAPFTFTYALHTYFRVPPSSTRVRGLDGLSRTSVGHDPVRQDGPVVVGERIDAIFQDAPDRLTLGDLYVEATNMPSAVVWNPGVNDVADIGGDFVDFLCVERGRIGAAAVTLSAGERHEAAMEIGLV